MVSMVLCEQITDFAIENEEIPKQFQNVGSVGMEVECQPERDTQCAMMWKCGVMFDSSPVVRNVNKPCEFASHQHGVPTPCYSS
jgi:hypothetical protein